jgi:hypothetical protein
LNKARGWGGRRPGAGAPRGNMNALKHGRRSLRMARLGMLMTTNPVVRDALLSIAGRWERKQMKAEEVAKEIFDQILERDITVADDRGRRRRDATPADIFRRPISIVRPPAYYRPSINRAKRERSRGDLYGRAAHRRAERIKSPPHQPRSTNKPPPSIKIQTGNQP